MTDYKKKIKNLLDLAESSNQYEAYTALLKARKLMAKYKISDIELADANEQEAVRKMTGIKYSMRHDPWTGQLAVTIAQYHCCKAFASREKRKQTKEIGIIGLSSDIEICTDIFLYAVDCVRQKTNIFRKAYDVRAADSYGYGFVAGLDEAYNKQQKEENWALVLVTPESVSNMTKNFKKMREKPLKDMDTVAISKGIIDGRKFYEQKRLENSNFTKIGEG